MLKSLIAAIVALLIAPFGVFHHGVAASPAQYAPTYARTTSPNADTGEAASAAAAVEAAQQFPAAEQATTTNSTTLQTQELSSGQNQETTNNITPQLSDLSSSDIPSSQQNQTPRVGGYATTPNLSELANPVAAFATKADLANATAALQSEIAALGAGNQTAPVSQQVAAGGDFANPFSAAQAIDNISNVTITSPSITGTLSASNIPALNYLSSSGGTVSGSLGVTGPTTLASSVTTTENNLITNGNFSGSAAAWTLGSSVVYGTNDIVSTYGANDSGAASTTFQTIAGNTYLLTFTVSAATGPLYVYLTHANQNTTVGMQGPFLNGTHTVAFEEDFTGTETITFDYWDSSPWYDMFFGNATGETWTLSNVSIKQASSTTPALEVTGYDGSAWLSLGNDISEDTALGQGALSAEATNNSGHYNTAIGPNTLNNNTTGGLNTAIGWDGLYSNTSGSSNVAIGPDALFENTSGGTNVAMGLWTMYNNTTGYDNTGDGGFALFSNTTGHYNTAGGLYALARNSTGSDNTAYGLEASNFNSSATNTVALGYDAAAGTAAYHNQGGTAIGYQAGYNFITGSDFNTLLGFQAGYGITTGNNNIWIGAATSSTAVANLTTGSQNILIGNDISLPSATASGQLDIGNIIYGTGVTGTGSTLSSGNVGIGTSSPSSRLTVWGPDTSGNTFPFQVVNSASTTLFDVADNGIVSIGTTSSQVSVEGTPNFNVIESGTSIINVQGDSSYADYQAASYRNTSGTHALLEGLAARGTEAAPSAIQTGDDLLSIRAGGYGTSDFDSDLKDDAAGIEFQADGTFSDSGGVPYHPGRIVFETANDVNYDTERMRITSTGLVGIGAPNPYSRLQVTGPDSASSTSAFAVVNSASTTVFSVFDGGNAELSGSLSQSSDQRLKTNITPLDASSSLSAIDQLNPVTFNWIDPNQAATLQLGFIAQQVQQIFPNLVSTTSATALTPDGTLSLNYIGLISPIVSAIKDIASISGDFETNLIAWLGNAGNGIGDLFANNLHAQNEICVGSTCIDQQQLAAVLAAAGQSGATSGQGSAGSASDDSATSTPDTPPVIQVNGDNPATIQVGASYADLGATITGPTADLNLGIQAIVDGGATTTLAGISIDTSTAATHTIEYIATDQAGNEGTAARAIIVAAPATSIPAGDSGAASTTSDATTTATSTP